MTALTSRYSGASTTSGIQLHPKAWNVAAGHVLKLQLLAHLAISETIRA